MKRMALVSAVFMLAFGGAAHANIITGSIWENDTTGAGDATPANVPASPADVTFFITGTGLNLNSGSDYTIGEFLNSGGGLTVLTGSGELGNTLDNTIFNFTGQVSVTNGEMFNVGHDDGLTLIIDGMTVVDEPGPTSYVDTPYTWTGATGTFNFQLVYGECCGAPADLVTDLPLIGNSLPGTPLPATLPLFASGLGALGLLGWRRKRKASVAA